MPNFLKKRNTPKIFKDGVWLKMGQSSIILHIMFSAEIEISFITINKRSFQFCTFLSSRLANNTRLEKSTSLNFKHSFFLYVLVSDS